MMLLTKWLGDDLPSATLAASLLVYLSCTAEYLGILGNWQLELSILEAAGVNYGH